MLEKLKDTLVHEMCHCAVWLIDHSNIAHGTLFKYWGRQATIKQQIVVTRCHDYKVVYKFLYHCKCCGHKYDHHYKFKIYKCSYCRSVCDRIENK